MSERSRRSMRGKFNPGLREGHRPIAHHKEVHHVRTAEGKLIVVDSEAEVAEILQHKIRRKMEFAMQSSLDLGFRFRPLTEAVSTEGSTDDLIMNDLQQLSIIVPLSDQNITLVGKVIETGERVHPQHVSLIAVTPTSEGKFTIDETLLSVDFPHNAFFDGQGNNPEVHQYRTGANRLRIMQNHLAHELKAQSMRQLMQDSPAAK